ncbi:DUF1294 domain-containing protein [Paenibacillus sp. CC-CFT747]|nr:DUF1294 domain-containing protein [Paenibacillus sp. CC-CFT747]
MAVWIWGYLGILNAVAFLMMYSDKKRAKRKRRRIPEARLFLTAALGGALGILLGMKQFRHKTLHASFTIGVPLLLFVNGVVFGYLLMKLAG